MANPNSMMPRVLIVDDELIQQKVVTQLLRRLDFVCESASTAAAALQILQARDFDVVLLDVQMSGVSGLEVLPLIRKLEDAPEVIMLTLDQTLSSGITAMRDGAYDYLTKPAAAESLEIIIKKATEKRRLVRRNSSLKDFVESRTFRADSINDPIYASRVMRDILEQADAIAPLNSTVLITGESGTGKDVLARYIHRRSLRAKSAMVAINCGAMPESLFESEFFGYEKGAFSGATQTKRGLLEAAEDSTLFLDEIGEMPVTLQVKLLRFLENGEFRRVGSTRDLFADTRLIAATNKDLTALTADGNFRSDLYYRLNVINLHIPPLRERRIDIPLLLDHFLEVFRRQFHKPALRFSEEARLRLENYSFPGNTRELKNIIERAAALADDEVIGAERLSIQKNLPPIADGAENLGIPAASYSAFDFNLGSDRSIIELEELERRYILAILNHTGGNRTRAAELLGISERTLYRRLRDYE